MGAPLMSSTRSASGKAEASCRPRSATSTGGTGRAFCSARRVALDEHDVAAGLQGLPDTLEEQAVVAGRHDQKSPPIDA